VLRAFRSHILQTHTAKAAGVGRLLTRNALGSRVAVVQTLHGHGLSDDFRGVQTAALRWLESVLGRFSDRFVRASRATVEDLVRMRALVELAIEPPARARLGDAARARVPCLYLSDRRLRHVLVPYASLVSARAT
jgi:hypothetical protein